MTGNTTRHGALVERIKSASISTYPPGFRSVLEAMLDIPRTTTPAFTDVAILPSGLVVGYDGQWYRVLMDTNNEYKCLMRLHLIELILDLCSAIKAEPRERFYLLELVKAMEFDGQGL